MKNFNRDFFGELFRNEERIFLAARRGFGLLLLTAKSIFGAVANLVRSAFKLARRSGKTRLLTIVSTAGIAFGASPAIAQVQRSVINTSFESNNPGGGGDPAMEIYNNTSVIGWDTTSGFVELWDSGFQSVPTADGSVFAELNATSPGALFQNICLINGETIKWRYQHRRRASGGPATQTVNLQVADSGGTVLQTLSTSSVTDATSWTVRGGPTSTVYTGASGVQRVQFSTSDPGSNGNFLDDITVTLNTYVEFQVINTTAREGEVSPTLQQIRISGSLSVPLNVTVNVAGGTATLGTDFTTSNGASSFVVTIPAGNYSGALFPLGITILDDNVVEGSETINLSLTPDPTTYTIANTVTCGAIPNTTSVHTIKDSRIAPVNDSVSGVNGVAGTSSAINAYTNDLFENNPVVVANIVGSVITPATPIGGGPIPALNVATGAVVVPAGTPSGTYTITYQICELADSTNCQTATITVIVSPATDLAIAKSNGRNGVTKGSTVTYTITATNNGPNSSTGAVVTDVVGTGLTCAAGNPVTVSSGGSYTVADLTGAGITLGTIANGGSVTLSYSCTVN